MPLARTTAKLASMRKDQTFTVYPMSDDRVMVQSVKAIGVFNPATRAGILNVKGNSYIHLSPRMGAVSYTFPQSFVDECMRILPAPGSVTALGGVTVANTVTVVS